ncbi:unnamed protein product [Eruca vesicaria subsp. sativa]|uniref:NHL repeat-containing protein n=1 Tax=Eruca vesicaria subsp. sativa TaxID=29727 RepID=A0ABC8KMU5_ERUVS|nr:unnamed protein product [Eruca vesicaria subsp. sativa]
MGESSQILSFSWSLYTLSIVFLTLLHSFPFQAQAAPPAGSLIKHVSSVLKWTTGSSSKLSSQSDTPNVVQFENGYLVETVVEGNEIGALPYKIRVSDDGELYAVDEVNSNIIKITPPLSHYSRGRLVAGSFQGKTGHADGKPNEARFNHPRGVTMDDKGNVYVADTLNLAIRKIGDSGVTTIAGGKSNVAGFRDGPSEDAKFSNDFDVVYVRPTCSLLVIDRGNAALRQISLAEEDCEYHSSSISSTDILLVIGAVVIGYATCLLQQGFGHSFSSKTSETRFEEEQTGKEKLSRPVLETTTTTKEEPGWPSFGQLLTDLCKLSLEFLTSNLVPARFKTSSNLRPLDRLKMPEDEQEPPLVQRHTAPAPISESRHAHLPKPSDSYPEHKTSKTRSSSATKDPTLSSSKHHRSSSKRQEYAQFYASGEVVQPPKVHKERSRRRHRDKTTEAEPKTTASDTVKPVEYSNSSKFDHFNMRNSKYGPETPFRF